MDRNKMACKERGRSRMGTNRVTCKERNGKKREAKGTSRMVCKYGKCSRKRDKRSCMDNENK